MSVQRNSHDSLFRIFIEELFMIIKFSAKVPSLKHGLQICDVYQLENELIVRCEYLYHCGKPPFDKHSAAAGAGGT